MAAKHQLGPPANKKKRKDDASDPIAAYRPTPTVRADPPSAELDAFTLGKQQASPLPHDPKQSIISYADMLAVIRQPGFAGVNMSEVTAADPIAKHYARWKFAGK